MLSAQHRDACLQFKAGDGVRTSLTSVVEYDDDRYHVCWIEWNARSGMSKRPPWNSTKHCVNGSSRSR